MNGFLDNHKQSFCSYLFTVALVDLFYNVRSVTILDLLWDRMC